MKILEKLAYEQFISFILENDIFHHNQYGYRHGYSTSYAALDVKEYIVNSLKSYKFACAVLIDLSKAFDTVDHKTSLKKLFCYGFQDLPFTWCESYLENREQILFSNNIHALILFEPVTVL